MTDDLSGARRLYDTVAASYARLLPDASFEAPEDLTAISRFLDGLPADARVLDAGCGTGRMLPVLRAGSSTLRLAGVDLSPGMLRHARLAHPDVPFSCGALHDLPYPAASFDGVLSWYSVIHTDPDDLPAVLRELRRVLVPGGMVLLAFQHGRGTRLRDSAYGHDVPFAAYLHHAADVAKALHDAGFTVVDHRVRAARDGEADDQGFVLARSCRPGAGLPPPPSTPGSARPS